MHSTVRQIIHRENPKPERDVHDRARYGTLDWELARFSNVRMVKRFDPFKYSIYAWYIKIAIAGSLTPVRLAWVPFLRVPKKGFIYVEADTKKLYAGL